MRNRRLMKKICAQLTTIDNSKLNELLAETRQRLQQLSDPVKAAESLEQAAMRRPLVSPYSSRLIRQTVN